MNKGMACANDGKVGVGMKVVWMALVAISSAVALAGCDEKNDACRIVRGEGYDLAEGSGIKTVLGRDLYWREPGYPKCWSWQDMRDMNLAMTRHIWWIPHGWFGINDLVEGINLKNPKNKRYANWTPQGPNAINEWGGNRDRTWTKYPAKFTDLIEKSWGKGEKDFQEFLAAYPDHPMVGWCPDLRPLLWLKPSFDTDQANYQEWKKSHPSFLGFEGFCEFDGEFQSFSGHVMPKIKEMDPEIYERIAREFQPTKDRRTLCDYAVKVTPRICSFYFGETNQMALVSNNPGYFFLAARAANLFYLEFEAAMGSCSGPFRLGGMYMRGCSRQYDVPYGWYIATWMSRCYNRKGENQPGDLQWPYGPKGSRTADTFVPYHGAPRSLLDRSAFYGLMIGSTSLSMEKCWDFFLETETPDAKPRPSQYMLDFNKVFDVNDRIDRGVPLTTTAVLVALEEAYSRSSYTIDMADKFSLLAFYNTLIPMHVKDYEDRFLAGDRKHGDVGTMWNSEFGEFVDSLVADADQEPSKFRKTLSGYKAAFLVGYFNKSHLDKASVEAYAKNGGTLFIDADKIAQGYVSEGIAGVKFAAEKSAAEAQVFAVCGEKKIPAFEFGEEYKFHAGTPSSAKPYLVDAKGNVIAWANDVGNGRVVTVSVDKMLPEALHAERYDHGAETFKITSNQRTFPLIAYLLRTVQSETLPVKVEGDIQWGCNKTKSGWLVWLINNNGVTTYAGEPEELDPKATSVVKVTFKPTGKVHTASIPAGRYGWIEIKE